MFGTNAASSFGSSTGAFNTSNKRESSAPISSSSFGDGASQQHMIGTKHIAFKPAILYEEKDGRTMHSKFQTISAMEQFSQKSVEELRYEDYIAKTRGNSNVPFGSTAINTPTATPSFTMPNSSSSLAPINFSNTVTSPVVIGPTTPSGTSQSTSSSLSFSSALSSSSQFAASNPMTAVPMPAIAVPFSTIGSSTQNPFPTSAQNPQTPVQTPVNSFSGFTFQLQPPSSSSGASNNTTTPALSSSGPATSLFGFSTQNPNLSFSLPLPTPPTASSPSLFSSPATPSSSFLTSTNPPPLFTLPSATPTTSLYSGPSTVSNPIQSTNGTENKVKYATIDSEPFGRLPSLPEFLIPARHPVRAHYSKGPHMSLKISPRGYRKPEQPPPAPIISDNIFVPAVRKLIKKKNGEDNEEEIHQDDQFKEQTENTPITPPCTKSRHETTVTSPMKKVPSYVPKLSNREYFTVPSIDHLSTLSPEQLAAVENFEVGRTGIGKVMFIGLTDVRGLDLDQLIQFEKGSIEVYPQECDKPEPGNGLNRRAFVTLERVFPANKTEESLCKWETKLRKQTIKFGASFVRYCKRTGAWEFEVDHF